MLGRTSVAAAIAITVMIGVASAGPPSASPIITITMSGMRFIPNHNRLQAHTSYVLRLANAGTTDHNLSAPELFRSAILPADEAQSLHDGQVDLPPGAKVDVALTTGNAGSYAMRCTVPFHALMGMTGRIEVQ